MDEIIARAKQRLSQLCGSRIGEAIAVMSGKLAQCSAISSNSSARRRFVRSSRTRTSLSRRAFVTASPSCSHPRSCQFCRQLLSLRISNIKGNCTRVACQLHWITNSFSRRLRELLDFLLRIPKVETNDHIPVVVPFVLSFLAACALRARLLPVRLAASFAVPARRRRGTRSASTRRRNYPFACARGAGNRISLPNGARTDFSRSNFPRARS